MSKAVDKFITDLEKNWGAKPKPGNVSPQAEATPDGKGGMTYKAGNPGPSKYSLESLNKALNEDDADVALMDPNDSALATAMKEINAVLPGGTTKETEMQISKSAKVKVPKGCFDTSKMLTAPTVTMMEATKLYQPVRGTSSGSRYFMFAISPALRVAVRWKSTPSSEGLALRVEGSGLTNPYTVKMLEQIGLDKKSDTHMSAHLTAANDIEARKALGALLFALNEPWSTPTPDPGVVCV